MRKISFLAIIFLLLIVSCTSQPEYMRDPTGKIGVISDIHGDLDNVKFFVDQFNEEKVDMILVLGDINDMNNDVDDYQEIYDILEYVAQNFIFDIYVIPGNHESTEDYYNVMDSHVRRYEGFHDLSDWKIAEDDLTIVPVPGYHDEDYMNSDGFLFFTEDLMDLETRIQNMSNILIMSHTPPKGKTQQSIDVTFFGENVGNLMLDQMMRKHDIKFSVSGHIHEAGMKAVDEDDNLVPENTWSETLRLNPGSATRWKMLDGSISEGSAAILEIKDGMARYEILRIP